MKKIAVRILLLILSIILLISCEKDFLERKPLDSLSEQVFFYNEQDFRVYLNGFYGELPDLTDKWGLNKDLNTDIIIDKDLKGNSGINQLASEGVAPITNADWNTNYKNIRGVNLFLNQYHKIDKRTPASNHFIGEGYFWRAWFYFNLLSEFGDVPIILKVLNPDDNEELYRNRDSRYDVAQQIIHDLDSAIINLQWKGNGEAGRGRINKEAAIVMKARVALFEGTWEYYHGIKGSQFKVQGKDGKDFLSLVAPTIEELIDHQGSNISMDGGIYNEPYNQLMAIEDGHSAEGIFLYRIYDQQKPLDGSQNRRYLIITDRPYGISKRLVDMYLDADGIPQVLSTKSLTTLNEWGQNLDPRMRETIWTPDRGPLGELPGRLGQQDDLLRYPVPALTGFRDNYSPTGIRNWKGAIFDFSQLENGDSDDILIRYAEGLLAYAEAKAILGNISQNDIDKTINVIRSRVGMTPMNLSEVNNWNITYDASEGFDPSAPNIVNEVRRERTVELAIEGFRLNDLKRWTVYEEVINGYKPKGAYLQEFMDYFSDHEAIKNDGFYLNPERLSLTKGTNIDSHSDGTINPFFRSTQFQEEGEGFWINKNRDYLSPIPTSEIILYEEYGVTLTQNPGWN